MTQLARIRAFGEQDSWRAQNAHRFPRDGSLRWIFRCYGKELAECRAITLERGIWYVYPQRMEDALEEIGARRALAAFAGAPASAAVAASEG